MANEKRARAGASRWRKGGADKEEGIGVHGSGRGGGDGGALEFLHKRREMSPSENGRSQGAMPRADPDADGKIRQRPGMEEREDLLKRTGNHGSVIHAVQKTD
jgi:hypothetical protein